MNGKLLQPSDDGSIPDLEPQLSTKEDRKSFSTTIDFVFRFKHGGGFDARCVPNDALIIQVTPSTTLRKNRNK